MIMCPNQCHLWARGITPDKPMTTHHPRCPRVDDSLIDVWRVQIPGEKCGCVTHCESDAHRMAAEDTDAPLEVVKLKMHREIYEQLGEFAGF